jgi:PKD repeat protein
LLQPDISFCLLPKISFKPPKKVKYTCFLAAALFLGMAGFNRSQAQCPIPNACTPGNASNAQASLFGGGIFQVKIGATFVNNSIGSAEGYVDKCSLGSVPVSLGSPFSVYVKTGNTFSENLRIFIDVNNDQTFSATTELFFSSNNAKVHSGSITIPSGVTGQPLKFRITSDLITSTALPGPCTTPEYSQVEDYAIVLQENVSPPVAAFSVSDTLTCSGNVTFTDQSVNNPTSWTWTFGDGQFSTDASPVHQYTVPGVYSVKLKVSNSNGVDSVTKTNLVHYNDSIPVAVTCQPITLNQCCGYGISRFALNTIDNSSGLGSYENFSCSHRTTLYQGR